MRAVATSRPSARASAFTNATRLPRLGYMEVIQKNLRVMDLTAITLCQENNLPIVVFDMNQRGNLKRVMTDASIGSIVDANP